MFVTHVPVANDDGTFTLDNMSEEVNDNWLLHLEALGNHILASQHDVANNRE